MENEQNEEINFTVDRSNLYREESFTDLKIGSIQRLTPVKPDGSEDKTRKTIFIGHTRIMTPHGPVPIQHPIQAKELQQAIKNFPPAMEEAMAQLLEEARKYQEQQELEQSQIQRPDSNIIIPGR